MPEGHTIHRLARDLNRAFRKKVVHAWSPQGRFEAGAARLDGQRCVGFEALGKHLIGSFASGDVLHVHLGLIGKFRKEHGEPIGAVRLRLSIQAVHWDLRGPMICTVGSPDLVDKVSRSIGLDPLSKLARTEDFVVAVQRRRIPIGAALLDQKVVAGIGNVYRAELLFLAGIDPETPANELDATTLGHLWDLTVSQMRLGEKLNRIVTVDPALVGYDKAQTIPDEDRLYVYQRDQLPCRVCQTPIELLEVGGRKMWRCPSCQ